MSLSPQFTKKNGVLLDNTDSFNGLDNYSVLFASGVYPEVKTWYKINTALGDGTPNYLAQASKSGDLSSFIAIFWGDGTGITSNVQGSTWSHTYATNGIYEIGYRGRLGGLSWNSATYLSREKIIDVLQWEQTGFQTINNFNVFNNSDNLVDFTASGYPRTSSAGTFTSAIRLFDGADVWNGDLSEWDVSLVSSFQETFRRCVAFNNSSIIGWDVSNNSRMSQMFYQCTAFNQPIGAWQVGNNGNFANMFQNASSFNQDISSWDVTNGGGAVFLSAMFQGASSFNQDISGWDVSNCTNFSGMFSGATSFTQDLSNWDVSSGASFISMMANCPVGDMTYWDVSNMNSNGLQSFFQGNQTGHDPDMSGWKFPSATPYVLKDAFKFNRSWTGGDLTEKVINPGTPEQYTAWDMSQCTDMHEIFSGNYLFNGDCSNWNVSNVTDLSLAFVNTQFNRDISSWDVSKCTNMASMLPASFTGQDLSSWNVGKVENFNSFRLGDCGDTTGWDMSSVITAKPLVGGTYDFGTWDLSSITEITLGTTQSVANQAKTMEGWGTNPLTNTGATAAPLFGNSSAFSKTATVGVEGYDGQAAYNGYLRLIAPTPNANRTTGTNTSAATDKLIDSGATFTASVNEGDVVANTTAGTYSTVVSVDSDIQLTLEDDIFTSTSQAYSVDGGFGWVLTGVSFS